MISKEEMLFNLKRVKKHLPFMVFEAISSELTKTDASLSREELSFLADSLKEKAEEGEISLTNYHAVIIWVAKNLGIEPEPTDDD